MLSHKPILSRRIPKDDASFQTLGHWGLSVKHNGRKESWNHQKFDLMYIVKGTFM